jgi:hypothetical protein
MEDDLEDIENTVTQLEREIDDKTVKRFYERIDMLVDWLENYILFLDDFLNGDDDRCTRS